MRMRRWIRAGLIFVLMLGLAVSAAAQGGYAIKWWSIDGGAGTSSGGRYALAGTLGQPDAGYLTGGAYTLIGGFHYPFGLRPRVRAPLLTVE